MELSGLTWIAEKDPVNDAETKLASGERLARIRTTRQQIPRDHKINGRRFYIEHRGQKTCINCLGGPAECKHDCDDKICKAN